MKVTNIYRLFTTPLSCLMSFLFKSIQHDLSIHDGLGGSNKIDCSLIQLHELPRELQCDDATFFELLALAPAERDEIRMFGKNYKVPHDQLNIGERGYKFSGKLHTSEFKKPADFHPLVDRIRTWVREKEACDQYEQVLINWYMSGSDCIGQHSDDEVQLKPGAPIYSFSYGSDRDFIVRAKLSAYNAANLQKNGKVWIDKVTHQIVDPVSRGIKSPQTFLASHNTCIIMTGAMQKYYTHELPRRLKVKNARINMTLRAEQSR